MAGVLVGDGDWAGTRPGQGLGGFNDGDGSVAARRAVLISVRVLVVPLRRKRWRWWWRRPGVEDGYGWIIKIIEIVVIDIGMAAEGNLIDLLTLAKSSCLLEKNDEVERLQVS